MITLGSPFTLMQLYQDGLVCLVQARALWYSRIDGQTMLELYVLLCLYHLIVVFDRRCRRALRYLVVALFVTIRRCSTAQSGARVSLYPCAQWSGWPL